MVAAVFQVGLSFYQTCVQEFPRWVYLSQDMHNEVSNRDFFSISKAQRVSKLSFSPEKQL
jgi:hypothetical protein